MYRKIQNPDAAEKLVNDADFMERGIKIDFYKNKVFRRQESSFRTP